MGATKDRAFAALKVAFAAARGCSIRTAQRLADKNDPGWQQFIGTQAADGMRQPDRKPTASQAAALSSINPFTAKSENAPPEYDRPLSEMPDPLKMRQTQWNIYNNASISWNAAIQNFGACDTRVLMLGQAVIKAQQAYDVACKKAEQYEISERRLIPSSEFQAVLPLLSDVFVLLKNMPAEIAVQANANNPLIARNACEEWLRNTFQPKARELLDKFSAYSPLDNLPTAA